MTLNELIDSINPKLRKPFIASYGAALAGTGVGGRNRRNFRLGSAILSDGLIAITAHNSYKTHPKLAELSPWPNLHAESAAILRYGLDRCAGTSLFVCRITQNGEIASAKPCVVCEKLIQQARIKKVYFTMEKGYGTISF